MLVLPRGLLGCAYPLPSPAGPSAPSPFTGGSAHLGAGRLERWCVRPPACLPPAETPVAPSHTCSICRPSFSRPPPQAPPPQLPEASQGVPPSLLPSPHRSLPAATPAHGIRLSMVAGDRCLPSPGCSPSTGRPPGAKPPPLRPPEPRQLFALTTSVISRAGGSAGRLAPPSRFPLHPGQAGMGAAPKRSVTVPSAPVAPLWTNH